VEEDNQTYFLIKDMNYTIYLILWGILGGFIAYCGISIRTWKFYVIIVITWGIVISYSTL